MTIASQARIFFMATILSVVFLSSGVRGQTVDVPYQGWLDLDDLPCTGLYDMQFMLYDLNSNPLLVDPIEMLGVSVQTGSFSVVLPIEASLTKDYEQLFLGVAVKSAEDVDYVPLINYQQIYPSVYAARSAQTTDFYVKCTEPQDDVHPGWGGCLVIGHPDGWNIGIDANEIMARDAYQTSTLYLNNEGGETQVGGDLRVRGNILIPETNGGGLIHDKPIYIKRFTDLGDDVRYDTGFSNSAWNAAIVGFRILDADIDETGVSSLFMLYMYRCTSSSNWCIRAEMHSDDPENWYVDVMFISTRLSATDM